MNDISNLKYLGLSQYEISCYLALVNQHPSNGSQLSRNSGIARSRIYDVLRNLTQKGLVMEVESGMYVPLPPEELLKRLQRQFDENLAELKQQLESVSQKTAVEYIWTIRGYEHVMAKAKEMIRSARKELYVRLFPEAGAILDPYLKAAEKRGVGIRYIAMGDMPMSFEIQVVHPDSGHLKQSIGGRSFDVIADRQEALVGIFETGKEHDAPINWTKNRWFITANRDSLRHDFYHYFLVKIHDRKLSLDKREERIYAFIKSDD